MVYNKNTHKIDGIFHEHIQLDQPELVISAIQSVLQAVLEQSQEKDKLPMSIQPVQTARQRPSVGPREGMPALDVQLQHKDGAKVRLSDYWQRSPIVLVFLRHFG